MHIHFQVSLKLMTFIAKYICAQDSSIRILNLRLPITIKMAFEKLCKTLQFDQFPILKLMTTKQAVGFVSLRKLILRKVTTKLLSAALRISSTYSQGTLWDLLLSTHRQITPQKYLFHTI